MENSIQEKIIKKLIHSNGIDFNNLWEHKWSCSDFMKNLDSMEKSGLVTKKNEKYFLTHEGKKLSAFIDGHTGKKTKMPVVSLLMVVIKKGKILLYERLKEPFYGYFGFPGAKLEFGEPLIEGVKRELKEETNLKAKIRIIGLMNYNTYNNGKLSYHHVHFVAKCINPKGKLKEKDREGRYKWVTKEEFFKTKLFPDDPYVFEWAENCNFFIAEYDRYQKNDEFKKIKIRRVMKY